MYIFNHFKISFYVKKGIKISLMSNAPVPPGLQTQFLDLDTITTYYSLQV